VRLGHVFIDQTIATETHEFSPLVRNRKANVANIIGTIRKGMSPSDTDESNLIVDSDWTANTFGPVEDFKKITVRDNSALDLYNAVSNISKIEIKRRKFHRGQIVNFNDIIGRVKVAYVHTDG
jgi:hypothetical protein